MRWLDDSCLTACKGLAEGDQLQTLHTPGINLLKWGQFATVSHVEDTLYVAAANTRKVMSKGDARA